MILLILLFTIIGGMGMAFQSPTNATLARYIGNFESTVINFAVGTVVLIIGTILIGQGDVTAAADAPFWQCLGGVYGVLTVLIITYVAPLLGIALTVTIIMLGQLIMGTVIDAFGLVGTDVVAIGPLRIAGCAVVAAGIVMVYLGKQHQMGEAKVSTVIIASAVSFLAGMGGAVQSPTNAALAVSTGNVEASLVNFGGGLIFITIVTLIVRRGHISLPERGSSSKDGVKAWMLTGGLYGSSGIFINVIATPYLGVALLVVAIMLGQLLGGLIVDRWGLMRSKKIKATRMRYLGVFIIMIGVAMVTVSKVV